MCFSFFVVFVTSVFAMMSLVFPRYFDSGVSNPSWKEPDKVVIEEYNTAEWEEEEVSFAAPPLSNAQSSCSSDSWRQRESRDVCVVLDLIRLLLFAFQSGHRPNT